MKRGGASSPVLPYHCLDDYEWTYVYMTLYCADATASGSSHQSHQNPLYCADATASGSSHQSHQNPSASSSSIPEPATGQVSVM